MPIYLNRWRNMNVTLTEAPNEDEYIEKLVRNFGEKETAFVSYKKLDNDFTLTLKLKHDITKKKVGLDGDHEQRGLLHQDQLFMMSDDTFMDVTVVVEDEYIKCHKVILARCEYYKKMLLSTFAERVNDELHLSGTTSKVFSYVRTYLYTRTLELLTEDRNVRFLCEFLEYVHMVDIAPLVEMTATQLEKELEKELSAIPDHIGCTRSGAYFYSEVTIESKNLFLRHLKKSLALSRIYSLLNLEKYCQKFIDTASPEFYNEVDADLTEALSPRLDIKTNLSNIIRGSALDCDNLLDKLNKFLESVDAEDIASCRCSPYFMLVCEQARNGNAESMPTFIKAVQTFGKAKFNVDHPVMISTINGEYGPVELNSTALLAACVTSDLEMVRTLLELGADPMYAVFPSGQTVLHVVKCIDEDDWFDSNPDCVHFRGKLTAKLQLLHQHTQTGGNIQKFDLTNIPFKMEDGACIQADKGYIDEVLKEFTCPLQYKEQAVEFSVAPDLGFPNLAERTCVDELRNFVHPRLQDEYKKVMETQTQSARESKRNETPTEASPDLRRTVECSVREDITSAAQFNHPDANARNEEALFHLDLNCFINGWDEKMLP